MQASGIKTGAMKPVESGCGREGDILMPYDGGFLKETARMDDPIRLVTPYCFENPLAPHAASEIEGTVVNVNEIKKAFYSLYKHYEAMVVEGVGGLMVPITKNYFVLDMAKEMGLPLIVVAKPGLGTINHTLLTVNYALEAGLDVAGVVINFSRPPEESLAEKTNPKLLSEICPVPVIGIFPFIKGLEETALEKAAHKSLNQELLKKYLPVK
jgi:dethiobiotin synthetase